jgi:hypothetical protein
MNRSHSVLISSLITGSAIVSMAIFPSACGKKKDSSNGVSIGAPQAYPPTKAVTPAQLTASSGTSALTEKTFLSTMSADVASLVVADRTRTTPQEPSTDAAKNALMSEVKSRLFSDGPTNLLKLIKNVDSRMAEYDTRSSGSKSAPACLSSTPVDLSTVFTVPASSGTTTIPLFGQCRETVAGSTNLTLIFGKKDNDWYLVDGTTKGSSGTETCIVSMVKVSGTTDASRVVDGYMVVTGGKSDNFEKSTTLMHFYADVAAGTLEFSAGGSGIGFDQVHSRTDGDFLYVQAQDSVSNSGALVHACFKASDLTLTSISDCSALQSSLSLVSLGTVAAGTTSLGSAVPATSANNVNLTTLISDYCGKISGASFDTVPLFSTN